MTLLSDDQKMLQATAAGVLADEGSIAKQHRHWRDTHCEDGFGHALWERFGELGLNGICIAERHADSGWARRRRRWCSRRSGVTSPLRRS